MRNVTGIYDGFTLKLYGLWLTACGPRRPYLRSRRGQTTVEYLLVLAAVAGMAVIMGVLFHKRILGGLFTMVGMVIGAGKPATPP